MATGKPKAARSKTAQHQPSEITFHYIKSSQHRVVHIDGVHGALSPHADIDANFFSERFPIPIEATHAVGKDKTVTNKPKSTTGKQGIIREVEISAVMSAATAESIGKWLIDKARQAKEIKER